MFFNDWTHKPPLGVQIRQGHPYAGGLVAALAFNEGTGTGGWDQAARKTYTIENIAGSAVWSADGNGYFMDHDADSFVVVDPDPFVGLANFTYIMKVTPANTGSTQHPMANFANPSAERTIRCRLLGTDYQIFMNNEDETGYGGTVLGGAAVVGVEITLAGRYIFNTELAGFVNGVKSPTTFTPTNRVGGIAASTLGIGGQSRNGSESSFPGKIHWAFIWNVALEDKVIADIGSNPWQLFAPMVNPVVFMDLAAPAGGPTFPYHPIAAYRHNMMR